jgi:hypothetical protein
MLVCLSGCSIFTSQSWRGDREWRYDPPRTGSNVGRWVPVGESSTPKSKRPKKTQNAKREQPRDTTPAPPPDRFR